MPLTTIGKNLLCVIPAALAYWVAFCPLVAMPVYNLLLFHPRISGEFHPARIAEAPVEDVTFKTKGGLQLFAWYVHTPKARCTVLISHGNAGNLCDRTLLIEKFVRSGAAVFAYDYQGFGRSQGSPSLD